MADWLFIARFQNRQFHGSCQSEHCRSQHRAPACRCFQGCRKPFHRSLHGTNVKRRRVAPLTQQLFVDAASSPASNPHTAEHEEGHPSGDARSWKRTAVLKASKQLSLPVEEAGRPLGESAKLRVAWLQLAICSRADPRRLVCPTVHA